MRTEETVAKPIAGTATPNQVSRRVTFRFEKWLLSILTLVASVVAVNLYYKPIVPFSLPTFGTAQQTPRYVVLDSELLIEAKIAEFGVGLNPAAIGQEASKFGKVLNTVLERYESTGTTVFNKSAVLANGNLVDITSSVARELSLSLPQRRVTPNIPGGATAEAATPRGAVTTKADDSMPTLVIPPARNPISPSPNAGRPEIE